MKKLLVFSVFLFSLFTNEFLSGQDTESTSNLKRRLSVSIVSDQSVGISLMWSFKKTVNLRGTFQRELAYEVEDNANNRGITSGSLSYLFFLKQNKESVLYLVTGLELVENSNSNFFPDPSLNDPYIVRPHLGIGTIYNFSKRISSGFEGVFTIPAARKGFPYRLDCSLGFNF